MAVFQQDLKALKKDLEIGSDTLEDRVTSFLYSLESFENTLDQIKLRFYQDNHFAVGETRAVRKMIKYLQKTRLCAIIF